MRVYPLVIRKSDLTIELIGSHRLRLTLGRENRNNKNQKKENTMAIEDVQLKGSWYAVFGNNGKKVKDLAASAVGELCGHSNEIIVFKKGSWYDLYDEAGKKLKTLAVSAVGEFRSVSGRNTIFKKGSWIDTYDVSGKKTNTRPA